MSVPIDAVDILKGDLIRKEYAPMAYSTTAHEYRADHDKHDPNAAPGILYLLDRPKPKVLLPTTPGYYFDKDGDPWKLRAETEDTAQHWRCGADYMDATDARGFAPFTLLRPVAEVAAEVLGDVRHGWDEPLVSFESVLQKIAAKFGATK